MNIVWYVLAVSIAVSINSYLYEKQIDSLKQECTTSSLTTVQERK